MAVAFFAAFAFFATFAFFAAFTMAFFVLAEAGAASTAVGTTARKRDRATGAEGQECGYEQCRQT
jgi:hypothetical protein